MENEYYDGDIVPVQHPNIRHAQITGNTSSALWERHNGAETDVFSSRMRLWIAPARSYTFPDIVAVDGRAKFADDATEILIDPTFIAEIYSPETEAYDRGEKFEIYKQLPSLRQYLLVAQNQPHIELYTLQIDGSWSCEVVNELEHAVRLNPFHHCLMLSEIYQHVEFKTSDNPAAASS